MGIRLIVEVWDHWKDCGLTAGERSDLQVIAENANDNTRETWPKGGIHQDYILERAGKSAAGWKNAIGKLMKKGVLAYALNNGREMSGFPGQVAVYRIPHLCPDPPHDGYLGQCKRERVTSQVTQSKTPSTATGHLSGDPISGTGHLSGGERVTSQVTPTPPTPVTTPSSAPPPPSDPDTPLPEGGGGGAAHDEQRVAAADFLRNLPAPWTAGRATAETLATLLLAAVTDAGWQLDANLATKLTENPGGINNYRAVLRRRIEDLPARQQPAAQQATEATEATKCSECDDDGFRYHDPDTELRAYRCTCRTSDAA